jgi:hypothetical protein
METFHTKRTKKKKTTLVARLAPKANLNKVNA